MKLRTLSAIALVLSAVYATPSMAFGLPSIPGIGGGAARQRASTSMR